MIEMIEMIGFCVIVLGLSMFVGYEIHRGIDNYKDEG